MNIDSKLGYKGIGKGKLSKSPSRNSELTDAYQGKRKLGNTKNSAGKLSNGNDPPCWYRNKIFPVFKGNMKERKPTKFLLDLYSKPQPSHCSFAG